MKTVAIKTQAGAVVDVPICEISQWGANGVYVPTFEPPGLKFFPYADDTYNHFKSICMYCKCHMTGNPEEKENISHGICVPCMHKTLREAGIEYKKGGDK